MIWPFDLGGAAAIWLLLYLVTLALHAIFVSFVLAGTAYALVQAVRRRVDPVADFARDWLPFMLGAGITAGVAPLLFLQLLYQRRFYTANLLMGPRWGAVVPALIVGFYLLYVAKAAVQRRWRIAALAGGVVAFAFVAWSWTELHLLMEAAPQWREMYAAGDRVFASGDVPPRLLLWLGAMTTLFATIAVWPASGEGRRRIAIIALCGRAVSAAAVGAMVARGFAIDGAARGWLVVMGIALAVEAVGWMLTWRTPGGRGARVATEAGMVALVAGVVVREAPRLALLEPVRAGVGEVGGGVVFAVTAAVGVAAMVWIVRTVRGAAPVETVAAAAAAARTGTAAGTGTEAETATAAGTESESESESVAVAETGSESGAE